MSTCDCGAHCADARRGCDRCQALDGQNLGEAAVIAALRAGMASPSEIAAYSGICREHVYRVLKRLRERGRVEFLGEVVEHFETKNRTRGRVGSTVSHRYELRSL